jgi:fatty-acyl-CoA synthase
MVTHANLMANVSSIAGPEGFGPARSEPYPDLVVSWLPLFHDMGLIGCVLTSLASGVPAVIISTTAFARDPRIWLRTIHRFRGTITYAPNFAYELAARRLRDRDLETLDLTSLRVAGCGGEPIRAATLASFAARLAAAGFRSEALVPSYGLAEATLAVTLRRAGVPLRVDRVDAGALGRGCATPAGEGADRVLELVSCGVPFSGQHVAVLDGDDRALPERRVGEITVTGPAVAAGYYRDPETTARTFRNGRLYTGDLGYLAGGELYVCGRLKDVIIIRGHNFYPQDIEWSVRDLPGIRQGSVVAFGVAEAGEERLVVAAETDHAEGGPLRESIAARIYESLGLEVGTIVLVAPGALPKTTSGKLMRTRAKQLFERGLLVDGCS